MGCGIQQFVSDILDRTAREIWIYLAFFVFVYILYVLRSYIRCLRVIFRLQGPETVPILGNVNVILEDRMIEKMTNDIQNYGRIFRIWVTCIPFVVVLQPEDIQVILSNAKHTGKPFVYKLLDNFLGKGLITRDVATWRINRKLLQPAFHRQVLERFTEVFAESAERLVDKFLETNEQDVNITSFINDSVYEILNETVLGLSPRKGSTIQYDELPFRKGQIMIPYRMGKPWLLLDWIYRLTKAGKKERQQRKDLFDTCFRIVKEKRASLRDSSNETTTERTKKTCLLEFMVEINEKYPSFTDEDIVEESCTFMLAGQDSVGTATAMTIFLLATHPEWQEKCIEEVDEIFRFDSSRSATMKDLQEMRCLEMCIKEALRLYPSVPLFARVLGEDVKIGKHVLPEGCRVLFIPYSTHRLPEHFPDASEYKPDRFNPENSEKRHPYAYLPFSAGPRNCIGYKFSMLEMKAMISALLRKCRLEPVAGKEKVIPKFRVTIRAQGGLWVRIVSREKFN